MNDTAFTAAMKLASHTRVDVVMLSIYTEGDGFSRVQQRLGLTEGCAAASAANESRNCRFSPRTGRFHSCQGIIILYNEILQMINSGLIAEQDLLCTIKCRIHKFVTYFC